MSNQPNIVMIMAEDTGRHQGCYGDPIGRTPNIDRLASEGTRYTNAFTHAPVCAPSRSGLVTGQYPTTIGSQHMRSTLVNPPRMFTHELRDAGYFVSWSTKTDFNFEMPPDAYDTTEVWHTDFKVLKGRPFFAFVNFADTHESTMWGEVRYEDSMAKWPDLERTDPNQVRVPAYLPDTPEVRQDIARYYDALAVQDKQVGEVLDLIEASGEADNTIVIYMSDHGRGLAREKRWCYDAGVHMPLIIRAPGLLEAGAVDDQLVAWVDIAPTLLSLAKASIPDNYQGQVFFGPCRNHPRQYVYGGRDRMDECFDRTRYVRSKTHHYIRNFYPSLPWAQRLRYFEKMATTQVLREMNAKGQLQGAAGCFMQETKPAEELYDVQADPDQVNNLADSPAHQNVLAAMRNALDKWIVETGDLSEESEDELILRGITVDRLSEEYRSRITALPPEHKLGPPSSLLTMQEAEAWEKRVRSGSQG